jgi:aspartate aminotransferase
VLILNSPSNPLGTIIPADRLAKILAFAAERDLWVISDECYDAITFDDTWASTAAVGEQDRVVTVGTFSKTYAMTGLRVGYAVVPRVLAPVLAKLQEPIVACVNATAQRGALAALTGPQDAVEQMRLAYAERRDALAALFDRLGVRYLKPSGAFYMWVEIAGRADDAHTFAMELLRERGVAVAPGTAFGASGEGWIRLSLATDLDSLLEGARRLADFTLR